MERLTVKYGDGLYESVNPIDIYGNEYSKTNYKELLKQLGEYEDSEEQNRLLKLPCAVGDTVYADSSVFGLLEYTVDNIIVNKTITFLCSAYSEPIGDCLSECLDEIEPDISDFGKTVFLTREQAEAALKELTERN
ncbi:MAG: hypothetical protein HFI70_03945 [Lachnospiraceae bacterium]|nr:hypothetical protein [Lachnospiraceae bacterium]